MTLAEFLLARIAEDDAMIPESERQDPEDWFATDWNLDVDAVTAYPKRWLAECDAKRRIVEHHRVSRDYDDVCAVCDANGPVAQGWPCLTLQLLALPYADHSDYDTDWRP